jgi:hypothetical protein
MRVFVAIDLPEFDDNFLGMSPDSFDVFYPALSIIGASLVIGVLGSRLILTKIREMSHRQALTVIFIVLGVWTYCFVISQILFIVRRSTMLDWISSAHSLACLSLFLGMCLVKGALNEKPTNTLIFGAVFSIVFAILNHLAWLGLKAFGDLLVRSGF